MVIIHIEYVYINDCVQNIISKIELNNFHENVEDKESINSIVHELTDDLIQNMIAEIKIHNLIEKFQNKVTVVHDKKFFCKKSMTEEGSEAKNNTLEDIKEIDNYVKHNYHCIVFEENKTI